ncbi:MAG: Acetophenone carboxylase gamma subunit, partial [Chlamydiae bacterium]|nr:Acetophenone carboxylase gamma subunit [Chlamydiota bacterium]
MLGELSAKIGVDVGGTNTDAALLIGNELVAACKTTTTNDITTGIVTAITALFRDSNIAKEKITSINIGTTHLVNACIQREGLNKVMVLRLAGRATTALPPGSDWPDDVREELIGEESYIIDGGYEYDGKEIASINPRQIHWAIQRATAKKVHSVAVIGVFANVNPSQEEEVKRMFNETNPTIHVTVSHTMGGIGLIARENATIVNAASFLLFQKISQAFKVAITELSLLSDVYLTYGDGTKTPLDDNASTPLKTFHSGPANSISGAAILSKLKDAVTVDIGGTTCDVGLLKDNKPVNENSSFPITGIGVRCNFVLPHLHSFGLGGGTIISLDGAGSITIGPNSVGLHLQEKALVFGGDVLTSTDIAVVV